MTQSAKAATTPVLEADVKAAIRRAELLSQGSGLFAANVIEHLWRELAEAKCERDDAQSKLAGLGDAIAGARRNINPFDDPQLDYLGDMREDVWKLSYIANKEKERAAHSLRRAVEAEANDKRYRYLKEIKENLRPDDGELCIAEWDDDWSAWRPQRNREQLDAQVDAALGAKAEG